MLARFRPYITGLVAFAATGLIVLDWPALAGVAVVA